MSKPETARRDDVSEWTHRLAMDLDPPPFGNEATWALLERYRSELVPHMAINERKIEEQTQEIERLHLVIKALKEV